LISACLTLMLLGLVIKSRWRDALPDPDSPGLFEHRAVFLRAVRGH
jgi:hypothetical protein